MGVTQSLVKEFKHRYPMTIGWRYKKHARVIEQHLNPGEQVKYAFIAQKNDNFFDIITSAVIAITDQRIMIGQKRVVMGYFFTSITPDLFNDLKVVSGLFWGKVYLDTMHEFVALSDISRSALPEIETKITGYIAEQKKKYGPNRPVEDK